MNTLQPTLAMALPMFHMPLGSLPRGVLPCEVAASATWIAS